MEVRHFFCKNTYTLTYIVYDPETKDALLFDPVLDYNMASSEYSHQSADILLQFINENQLNLHYIIETHIHADHLSASAYLKKHLVNVKTVMNQNIPIVQSTFQKIYNFKDAKTDGSQFDRLVADQEEFHAGSIQIKVLHTPGHTPACTSYLINETMVFTGDALFMPDFGVGRCDFPNGSAEDLYESVTQKLYSLDDSTIYYTGHDYMPNGRELRFSATIGESKKQNIHIKTSTTKEDFVRFRNERDKNLNAPKLLLPSIQVNVNAGKLPQKENNGIAYLKIPIQEEK